MTRIPYDQLGAGRVLHDAVRDLRALGAGAVEAAPGRAVIEVLRSSGRLPRDPIERTIVMEARETHEEWMRRIKQEGRKEGLEPLMRLFERKLGVELTNDQRAELVRRLDRLGPTRLGDVALDLDPASLARWLADPSAP